MSKRHKPSKQQQKLRKKAINTILQETRLAPIVEQQMVSNSSHIQGWLDHYASMEMEDEEDDLDDDEEDEDDVKVVRERVQRSRAQAFGCGMSLALAELRSKREEQDIRAAVRKITQPAGAIKIASLEAFILRALHKSQEPMKTENIIDAITALGFKSKSKHHLYDTVSKMLNRRYMLFERLAPGLFGMKRSLVSDSGPKKVMEIGGNVENGIPSFGDVAVAFTKKYSKDGVNPSDLRNILEWFGVDTSYRECWNVLNDERYFVKDGFEYRPKEKEEAGQSMTPPKS